MASIILLKHRYKDLTTQTLENIFGDSILQIMTSNFLSKSPVPLLFCPVGYFSSIFHVLAQLDHWLSPNILHFSQTISFEWVPTATFSTLGKPNHFSHHNPSSLYAWEEFISFAIQVPTSLFILLL